MTLLFLVFYYLIDMSYYYQVNKKKAREVLEHMVKTMGIFLLGLGCSAIVFIPYMDDTLSSPRVSGRLWPSFHLGTLQEYGSLILRMFSNTILGINTYFGGIANFYECPFMYIGIVAVMVLPLYLFCSKLRKKYWLPMVAIVFVFYLLIFQHLYLTHLAQNLLDGHICLFQYWLWRVERQLMHMSMKNVGK